MTGSFCLSSHQSVGQWRASACGTLLGTVVLYTSNVTTFSQKVPNVELTGSGGWSEAEAPAVRLNDLLWRSLIQLSCDIYTIAVMSFILLIQFNFSIFRFHYCVCFFTIAVSVKEILKAILHRTIIIFQPTMLR